MEAKWYEKHQMRRARHAKDFFPGRPLCLTVRVISLHVLSPYKPPAYIRDPAYIGDPAFIKTLSTCHTRVIHFFSCSIYRPSVSKCS